MMRFRLSPADVQRGGHLLVLLLVEVGVVGFELGEQSGTVQLVPRLRGILARVAALRPCQAGELRAFRYAAEDLAGVLRVGLEGLDGGIPGTAEILPALTSASAKLTASAATASSFSFLSRAISASAVSFAALRLAISSSLAATAATIAALTAASSIWPLLLPRATIASADKLIFPFVLDCWFGILHRPQRQAAWGLNS